MKKFLIPIAALFLLTCEFIQAQITTDSISSRSVVTSPGFSNEEKKWILKGVSFNKNSTQLLPESFPIIDDAVKTLLNDTTLIVEIQCYTNNVGAKTYNKLLSQKRADIVKNYMVSKGVPADRLQSVGYGEINPIGDNKPTEGRAMNDRIELKIIPGSTNTQEPVPDSTSTKVPSNNKATQETIINRDTLANKITPNELNNKEEKISEPEKKIEQPQEQEKQPAKNLDQPKEEKPVKKSYNPVIASDKPAVPEKEKVSNLKYFTENFAGAYWFWYSANYFADRVGYSFVTIHGFTSDNPGDVPIVRGLNRGIGVGYFTVAGNTAINVFAHARFRAGYVLDIGYTFSSSNLKGFYSSIAYGIPIHLSKTKTILIDLGAAYIGSPALFVRLGLLL